MKYLEQDEINKIAKLFVECRRKVKDENSLKEKQDLIQTQNECVKQLQFLVSNKARKYKKFSNHSDLEQDGFEALILALKTYDSSKGCFSWWADKYISTRISRAANAHSTIRFPLKKAKETRPYKTSTIPIVIDSSPSAQESLEISEQLQDINKAISSLSIMHQKVINMTYGFNGNKPRSMISLTKELSLSKPQCLKLLQEARSQLKEILQ